MMRQAAAYLTAVCCLLASQVHALGLGTLSLESSLNQPLRARIEIVDLGGVSPADIVVQMASQQEFQRFNLERTNFLSGVSFEIERSSSGVFVILTSSQAVREPFLSFILDTRWPSGRILSEHTVLLDLPVFSDGRSVAEPINQPVSPAVEPQQGVVQREPAGGQAGLAAASATEPAAAQEEQVSAEPQADSTTTAATPRTAPVISEAPVGADTLEIQESDTLWEIAMRVRPDDSVSIQQTMLAIQRMNPNAFANGNINRMQAGATLQIPDLSEIQSISQQQAVSEVSRQNQQADLSVQPLTAPSSGPSAQAGVGRQGQLRVLSADDAEPVNAGAGAALQAENAALDAQIRALENQLVLQEEEVDRVLVQQAELVSRLNDLDLQIESALEIIRLQDQQLAQLQQSLAAAVTQVAEEPAVESQPAPAQVAQVQPVQSAQPSFLDSVVRVLSSSATVLALVAVLVVLLTVMLLVRRNRAAAAAGLEHEFAGDLGGEDVEGEVAAEDRFTGAEPDPDDADEDQDATHIVTGLSSAAAGAVTAISRADSAQFSDEEEELGGWDDDADLEEPAAAGSDSTEFARAELAGRPESDDELEPETAAEEERDEDSADVLDFELDTELGQAEPESDDLEVLDFDIDDFLDEEESEQAAVQRPVETTGINESHAASDSGRAAVTMEDYDGVDFEVDTGTGVRDDDQAPAGAELSTDHGESIEFTPATAGGTASSETQTRSASTSVGGQDGQPEEDLEHAAANTIETLDFDLGQAGIDEGGSVEVDEEITGSASQIDTFDFELNEVADAEQSTADGSEPEAAAEAFASIEFELSNEDTSVKDSEQQADQPGDSVDFALDEDLNSTADADEMAFSSTADTSAIAIDFEPEDDASEDIEIELEEGDEPSAGSVASVAADDDLEIELTTEGESVADIDGKASVDSDDAWSVDAESLADEEVPTTAAVQKETTGFGPATPAANEEEVGRDQQVAATLSDPVAKMLKQDENAAAPGSAIEVSDLDFLSADKEYAQEGTDDELDFLSDDDEAATKLDLAYAYQKMGDVDGAKEILEEVINEGNDAQANEARNLMEALRK